MNIPQTTESRRRSGIQMVQFPATTGALAAYLMFLLAFGFTVAVVLGVIP